MSDSRLGNGLCGIKLPRRTDQRYASFAGDDGAGDAGEEDDDEDEEE